MRIGNLHLRVSAAHLNEALHPSHGPEKWPWWKVFSLRLVRLAVYSPSSGRRLWVYFRSSGAVYVEAYIDRRDHQ